MEASSGFCRTEVGGSGFVTAMAVGVVKVQSKETTCM